MEMSYDFRPNATQKKAQTAGRQWDGGEVGGGEMGAGGGRVPFVVIVRGSKWGTPCHIIWRKLPSPEMALLTLTFDRATWHFLKIDMRHEAY